MDKKDHIEKFVKKALDCELWIEKADELIKVAALLKPHIDQNAWNKKQGKVRLEYYPIYFMLMSYALENLLKALKLKKNSHLKERLRQTRKLPEELKTHNIYSLAKDSGLLSQGDYPDLTEDLLKRMSISATWFSRYPTPVKADDMNSPFYLENADYYGMLRKYGSEDVSEIDKIIASVYAELGKQSPKSERRDKMEQRTVKISKIRITKSDLLSMCENERVFFVQSGDLLNDLNVFNKLLFFCMNRQTADKGAMKTAKDIQTMCLIKILVGKLNEGWKLIEKWYYGTAVSKKYDGLLEQSAKVAVDEIKKYFSKGTNLISEIRNRLAFHYGPKKPEEWRERVQVLIDKMQASQILEVYVSKAHGNCLFPMSNDSVILDILNLTGEPDNEQAWKKLHGDFKKVINWFIDFLDGYHLAWAQKYGCLASDEEEVPAPSIKNVSLPYFTTD